MNITQASGVHRVDSYCGYALETVILRGPDVLRVSRKPYLQASDIPPNAFKLTLGDQQEVFLVGVQGVGISLSAYGYTDAKRGAQDLIDSLRSTNEKV